MLAPVALMQRGFGTVNKSNAAETPATHMQRTMSLDRSVQSFYEKQTGQELTISSISKFMDESLLRGSSISFS